VDVLRLVDVVNAAAPPRALDRSMGADTRDNRLCSGPQTIGSDSFRGKCAEKSDKIKFVFKYFSIDCVRSRKKYNSDKNWA
jgi:hypothetical protein